MADRTLRESREAFRQLVDDVVDDSIKQRVWQLLEAIVFSETPILRGLERFEVRFGDGAPTVTEYPKDGLGVWVDETADEIYVVLKWRSEFYFVGGSGSGSVPTHDHDDHTSIGANTHTQIDTHIADGTIHFTDAAYLKVDGSRNATGEFTFEADVNIEGDLFLILATSEPADGELANGEMVLWYQAT